MPNTGITLEQLRGAAEAAGGAPVEHWEASVRYDNGSFATHDLFLPAGATETDARYWAFQGWRLARRANGCVEPSLAVRCIDRLSARAAA